MIIKELPISQTLIQLCIYTEKKITKKKFYILQFYMNVKKVSFDLMKRVNHEL